MKKKSNKEEYVEDENLCSFSSKEINKLSEETKKLLQGKEKEYLKNYEKKYHSLTEEEKEYVIKIKREAKNLGTPIISSEQFLEMAGEM